MKKKAVLVGINYHGKDIALAGTTNDVLKMKSLLLNQGYLEENILIVTESTIIPTRANIVKSWRWLFSGNTTSSFSNSTYIKTTEELKTVFYYSGHGVQINDANGDETDKKDECIVPLDYQTLGVITDDVIRLLLINKVPIDSSLFVLLDCCNSGSGCDLPYNFIINNGNIVAFDSNNFTKEQEITCISAVTDDSLSYELQGKNPGGIFTNSFISSYYKGIFYKDLLFSITRLTGKQTPVLSSCSIPILDKKFSL